MRIYTDTSFAPKGIKWLKNVDGYFNANISARMLTPKDLQYIRRLEHGILINKDTGLFENPETGYFSIEQLSTGMKALILARYLNRLVNKSEKSGKPLNVGLNVTECGSNYLDYIFEETSNRKIALLLQHTDVLKCRDRYFTVNGGEQNFGNNNLFATLCSEIKVKKIYDDE